MRKASIYVQETETQDTNQGDLGAQVDLEVPDNVDGEESEQNISNNIDTCTLSVSKCNCAE